jgi:hypothetical protein
MPAGSSAARRQKSPGGRAVLVAGGAILHAAAADRVPTVQALPDQAIAAPAEPPTHLVLTVGTGVAAALAISQPPAIRRRSGRMRPSSEPIGRKPALTSSGRSSTSCCEGRRRRCGRSPDEVRGTAPCRNCPEGEGAPTPRLGRLARNEDRSTHRATGRLRLGGVMRTRSAWSTTSAREGRQARRHSSRAWQNPP